jgi:non-specific serine/threonine protein kinase/serine/threonine-protein kinase
MTPERWEQVRALCQRALERPPDDRAAFLAQYCLDDRELTREIESRLTQAAGSQDAIDGPVWEAVAVAMARCESDSSLRWLPNTIGRYRVLRLIGEGGMGAVYEAEQENPRRVVALKVIRPGLMIPETLRRFEREWQALGRLQHPGIAQIYEAGTADTGFGTQPYFAMELIRGNTLKEYVAEHQLTTRARLDLVAQICDAVQHAHDRGLIHRDLKPGNILVDRAGQPKILDFGVARLTDSDAHTTKQTDLGQLVGTLAYMSPEQVLADPQALDARSDVYALGIILYELLAGRMPYTINNRLHEAVQIIREEDPGRLSSISRSYRGDIETIVAKSLEKDKTRRYASAAALADDIRRYLSDQPITARAASATYQLRKFARRHKAAVGGLAAVFVVLIGGIVASTWQAVRARHAERQAVAAQQQVSRERDEATKERNRALDAEKQAEEQRNRALDARAQAQQERNQAIAARERADTEAAISQAVSTFLQKDLLAQAGAREQATPDTKPDPDLKVRTALDRAAQRIDGKFRSQPVVEASIRMTMGTAYQDLGLYAEAHQHYQRALDLRKTTLGENAQLTTESLANLAAIMTQEGTYAEAEALYLRTLQNLRRTQGAESHDVLDTVTNLASLYQFWGKYPQAQALIEKTLATQQRVLGPDHPDTVRSLDMLSRAYYLGGKYADAERTLTTVIEVRRRLLGPDHPDTISSMSGLSLSYDLQGKGAEAEALYLKLRDTYNRVHGPDHPETLANLNNLAVFYKKERRYAEAEPLYVESLAVRRRTLGEEHPDTLGTMNNLGALYNVQSRFDEATSLLTKTLDARKRVLGAEHPHTLNTIVNLAQTYSGMGRFADAAATYAQVLEARRRVLGPDHPETLFILSNLGVLESRLGRWREAEAHYTTLLEARTRTMGESHPTTLRALDLLGGLCFKQGDFPRAEALFSKALEGRRRVLGENHPDTLYSVQNVAVTYDQLGKTSEAESMLESALNAQRKVLGDQHFDTVTGMERLAGIHRRSGRYDAAQALLSEATEARRRAGGAKHPDTVEDLALLGLVGLQQQKYSEVETLLKDFAVRDPSAPDTWWRFFATSVLGAALSAEKRYEAAEPLLIDGYHGLAERAAIIPADSKSALDHAGEWIVQLYRAWGKPDRALEWSGKLEHAVKAPQKDHP